VRALRHGAMFPPVPPFRAALAPEGNA